MVQGLQPLIYTVHNLPCSEAHRLRRDALFKHTRRCKHDAMADITQSNPGVYCSHHRTVLAKG